MNSGKKAVEIHNTKVKHFNCAQSVLMSLTEYTGIDSDTSENVAAGFGSGMQCKEMCGAISGGIMALGLAAEGDSAKAQRATRALTDLCKEHYGCLRCADLKNNKIICDDIIEFAADNAEEIIKNY